MKKKVLAIIMAALMAASLTAREGSAKETTAADITAAATAEKKTGDTTITESKNETNAEAAEAGAAKEVAGDKLIMATNAEFPPYEYHDGGAAVDIDTEITKATTGELGVELETEGVAFNSIIPKTVSGEADMGLADMTITEDHTQSVGFSDACAKASQKVIATEDSGIASPDGLKGIIIGVQLGATSDIYVSDLEVDGTAVERYSKGFGVVQALSQGKINAAVIGGEPTKTFVTGTQGLKILDEFFTGEKYAIAVKKGNTELLEKISGTLKTLKNNGTLGEVVAKYIKTEQSYRVWDDRLRTDKMVPVYTGRRPV